MSISVDIKTITERLSEPFPSTDIEWRIGATDSKDNPTKGIALAYITNRAVQQRLDDVVGIANWRNEYREWKATGVLCGLSLRIDGEWVTKFDGSDESDMEAIKGGFSDAMKRASYQWGIGRYLYNLENVWVPVEKRGRTTMLRGLPPQLPDWALPENERGKKPLADAKPTPAPKPAPAETSAGTPTPVGTPTVTLPTPARSSLPTLPAATISEPQLKRLFAIAKSHGYTDDDVHVVLLSAYNIESGRAILRKDYETIVETFNQQKETPNAGQEFDDPFTP